MGCHCQPADWIPSSRCWMPRSPRTPKKLSPMAIPFTRASFPERNTLEEITARNSQSAPGQRLRPWRMRFHYSSGPSSATITSSVPGTWTATCVSSAGGTTDAACRPRSSRWRWPVWSAEHRYRTRRWLRSNCTLARARLLLDPAGFPPSLNPLTDLDTGQRLGLQHPSQNLVEPLLRCSLTAHRHSIPTHSTCVIGMIIPISKQYRAGMSPLSHQESPKPPEAQGNPKSLPELSVWICLIPHLHHSC